MLDGKFLKNFTLVSLSFKVRFSVSRHCGFSAYCTVRYG
jgi:hypothetical protein